jgi:hypothetical protein
MLFWDIEFWPVPGPAAVGQAAWTELRAPMVNGRVTRILKWWTVKKKKSCPKWQCCFWFQWMELSNWLVFSLPIALMDWTNLVPMMDPTPLVGRCWCATHAFEEYDHHWGTEKILESPSSSHIYGWNMLKVSKWNHGPVKDFGPSSQWYQYGTSMVVALDAHLTTVNSSTGWAGSINQLPDLPDHLRIA